MDDLADTLQIWIDEIGPKGWYVADPAIDGRLRARFQPVWQQAADGQLLDWCETARGCLAYLIVTDQFSRNMFRDDPRAFATDALARDAARTAIARGFDLDVAEPERVFFYMPFEHSEESPDQDWSVALMKARLPEGGEGFAFHATVHREVIRRFGRFPYRNAALGRVSTAAELTFLGAGGYGAMVRECGG